jgi:hypothetical protein
LRPSKADKQKAVTTQLALRPERSDREIARLCGVSPTTVGEYRRKLSPPTPEPDTRQEESSSSVQLDTDHDTRTPATRGQESAPRTWKTAGELADEAMAHELPVTLLKAGQEAEWVRRFDARCVRIHELVRELERQTGATFQDLMRGWEPDNQATFAARVTDWMTYFDALRQGLGTREAPAPTMAHPASPPC